MKKNLSWRILTLLIYHKICQKTAKLQTNIIICKNLTTHEFLIKSSTGPTNKFCPTYGQKFSLF